MWKQIHMTPEEAVKHHKDVDGKILVPLHWATFDLALHPWYEPIERALKAAEIENVTMITPIIGSQVSLKSIPPGYNFWWRELIKDKN